VGSANMDMVVQVSHLPIAGETVLGGTFVRARGGKGANQAVTAARLGGDVTFVARLGRDRFGQESVTAYQAEGINVDHIIWDDETPSGVALIMVNQAGENIIAVAPGANSRLAPEDVMAAEGAIKEASCVLMQLEIPLETVRVAVELAARHNIRVILNPAPAVPLSDDLLKKVDILTPNESEAATLVGGYSPQMAKSTARLLYSKLHSHGIKTVVVTLGAEGALLLTGSTMTQQVPSFAVKPVDTTGAGDAFNGALAVALARGMALSEAVRYANATGALTVTRTGAQPSLPTSDEVEQFLSERG
jgi:ribokinase